MKGKADKLVANRTLSALVVLCVMLSAFAGLIVLVKPSSTKAASLGDLNIVGTRYTMENIYQPVDGNVTIGAGGELFIKDATLAIVSSDETYQRHFITVSAGGKLTLEHATITTYLDQLTSWPFLTLTVTGANSVMTATSSSVLMFPGSLVISTQALVSLHETTVTAHPNDKIVQYYAGSDLVKADRANDGPSISLTNNARLSIFDSSFKSLPEFLTAGDLAGNMVLSGSSNFLSVNSYVGVDFVPGSPSTHNVLSLSDSHAYLYGTVFDETYAGSDRLDPIVVLTSTSNATVYRWVNVTVGDEYGVPISNAKIKAVYTGSSSLQGQIAKYYTASGVANVPPAEVLDYLGVTGADFNVTKSDGKAVVPYMSDIITYDGTGTTSQFVGSYLINGSATVGMTASSESSFSFPAPYPAMGPLDRYYSETVRIEGVSAQSPDPSRWLVVPLSPGNPYLNITNMTYYHAGDVIVAADGTLRFYNAELQMIQTSPYQRTIYVDNTTGHPAMLVFEKSKMVSPLWINITVQGHAVLKIMNSTLEGVNIIARENSKVILINATMDGKLSTEWDAAAEVIVKDSSLVQAPLLSGDSRGHFTNSSIPSVAVEGNALAYIYRWIHVTVLDAAGKPLPGATVTTRSYPVWIPGVQNGSAVSSEAPDSLGVAKVNSLASILTSAGPPYRYVGNYMVSANYMTYWSTANISVGVLPYSEPLGKNATYATMSITGTSPDLVLPSLTVHQTWAPTWPVPVWANLTASRPGDPNPLPGENVTVHATIYNDGVSYAYNVRVNFYDQEVNTSTPDESRLFGTVVIPMIRPMDHADVQVYWTATGIVSPSEHTLIVKVDPDNTVWELDDPAVTLGYGFLTVQSLPDLYIFPGPEGAREITCSATYIVVNSTVTLSARVHNIGTLSVSNIPVYFYDGSTEIANTTVSVPAGGAGQASVSWTSTMPAPVHTIRVVVNPSPRSVVELNYDYNEASVPFEVLDYPDLDLSAMSVTPSGAVPGGDTVVVTATLNNLQKAPVWSPSGVLWVDYASERITVPWSLPGAMLSESSGSVQISAMFTAPILTVRTDASLTLIANPDYLPVEKTYANNLLTATIAFLDVRPDLSVVVSDTVKDIYVQRGTQNVTGEMFGRALTVNVIVHNLGGSNATDVRVHVGVRNAANTYNHTLLSKSDYNVSSNATANTLKIAVPWTMNLSAVGGAYQIWVWVDESNVIAEADETDNFAYLDFAVVPLDSSVSILTDASEYKAGDMMLISATVQYNHTSDPVKGLQGVVFWLTDSAHNKIPNSNTSAQTTDPDGSIIVLLRIPTNLPSGSYLVRAEIGTQSHDSEAPVHVSAAVEGGLFPLWVWILIIVAVVGVVAGFFVYTYIYGLGKLVECGECGAFIPAASKRCPKCGVEFEAGTMKCSECGAWIPAESAECPNCGVKFVGEAEEEADYMERMRKEYDDMVSKYRELAKPELGKKYSEKAFDAWWKAQPGHIAFEDWLAKEEEKKKEGPIPCPVCGTLNPKEATVCHKCGTVFGAVKTAPAEKKGPPPAAPPEEGGAPPAEEKPVQAGAAPPVVAPRMVIRRPIDRKVVPKKIIKTPLGTEDRGSEEKDEDNQ